MVEQKEEELIGDFSFKPGDGLLMEPPGLDRATVKQAVTDVAEQTLNEDLIREHFENPERAEEYIAFARRILAFLPTEERAAYAKDPTGFVSKTFAFRGLTLDKYEKLKAKKAYMPESGHFGSRGVYLSNRPYAAFTFQEKAVIALVPVANLQTIGGGGFHEVGSPSYRVHVDSYVNNLSPTLSRTERSDALYDADSGLDLLEIVKSDIPVERNLVARQPQPIEVTRVFLVWKDGEVVEENLNLAA